MVLRESNRSTSLKTVSMYLRAAKTEAEDAGESTDGMADSVSKLREELLKLTGNRVDIMADDSTFKSTYQILEELSKVWKSLSDVTQANILEMIGGKRNSNVVSALLNNFETAQEVMVAAGESAGSALQENEKYLDSINGRISILKASFEELSTSVLESDYVKTGISGLTKLLEILTKVNEGFGLMPFVTASIGLTAISKDAKKASLSLSEIFECLARDPIGTVFKKSEESLLSVGSKLFLILEAITLINSAVKLLTGKDIVGWIKAWINPASLHLEKVNELAEEYEEASSKIEEYSDKIKNNKDRIKELQDLAASGKLTAVEQSELNMLDLENQQLERMIENEKELARIRAEEHDSELISAFEDAKFKIGDSNSSKAAEWEKYLKKEQGKVSAGQYSPLLSQNSELVSLYNNIVNGSTAETYVESLLALYEMYEDNLGTLSEEEYKNYQAIEEELRRVSSELDSQYIKELYDQNSDGAEQIKALIDAILNALPKSAEVKEGAPSVSKTIPQAPELIASIEEQSKIQDVISKSQEEMAKSGSISFETIEKLKEITDEYTKYLYVENGAIKMNIAALREYEKEQYAKKIDEIDANISYLENKMSSMGSHSKLSENDSISALEAEKAALEQERSILEAAEENLSDASGLQALNNALGDTTTEMEQIQKVMDAVDLGDISSLSETDFSAIISIMPSVTEAFIRYRDAVKAGNNAEQESIVLMKELTAGVKDYIKTNIAESFEEAADAANNYGRDSAEVKSVVDKLRKVSPELADAIWDVESGLIAAGDGAQYTKEGLFSLSTASLSSMVAAMRADLNLLIQEFGITAAQALTLKATFDMLNGEDVVDPRMGAAIYNRTGLNASEYKQYSDVQNNLTKYEELLETLIETSKSGLGSGGGGSSETLADKIKETFDALNASIEHTISLHDRYYTEAREDLASDKMREHLLAQITCYQRIQTEAHKAADALRAYYRAQGMSADEIEKQSDIIGLSETWWNAADSITEVIEKMAKDISAAFSESVDEIQKAYDTLHAAADEYAQSGFITVDTLQNIIGLGVEYLAFLQDENGQLIINEERIKDVIAARTQQMAVESALAYVEAIRAAKNAGNVEELNRLLTATKEATSATWGFVYASLALVGLEDGQYQAALRNINALRALADSAVTSIGQSTSTLSDSLKDMQKGVDDILKYVMDMIEQEIENQIDALEDLKDAYSDLIELKKESLEATKEESDYTDQVAELTQKIAKIQSEIDLLDLVGTRESEAQKTALLEEQAELQKELANLQGDYAYDAQVDALDKMEEAYHEEKDDEIKILEDKISSEEKLYQLAIDRIETQWSSLYDQLITWNTQYGSVINDEITSAWDNACKAVQRYGSFVAANANIQADIDSASSNTPNYNLGNTNYDSSYTNDEAIRAIVWQMKQNAAAWHGVSKDQQKELERQNEDYSDDLAAMGLNVYKKNGIWYLSDGRKLFDVYHEGGVVGGVKTKDDEQLALLKKKEWVLSENMVGNLVKQMRVIERLDNIASRIFGSRDLKTNSSTEALIAAGAKITDGLSGGSQKAVSITIGDTYITGANEDTVKQHQQVNKRFLDDLATQLGVRW